jgi:hypothetical protein
MTSAADIAAALGGSYRSGSWWRCRCPVHNSKGATLALRDGREGMVVHCHAGCRRDDILNELDRLGLLGQDDDAGSVDPAEWERQREADERRRRQRTAKALDFWENETVPPASTLVERYWREARGLTLPLPETIRASRSWLRHPEGGSRPAMIALVQHADHGPVAIHRTWLAVDGSGKASFRSPRLSLGPTGGAAVHLADATEHEPLVIGEGIETAASVMVATGFPAWAAISAGGIERLILPVLPAASSVIIAADHDRNGTGEHAARTVAGRWLAEGRRVRIALPPIPGSDWNDVLQNKDNMETRHAAA